MEANRITAPRRGSLRTVIDRVRALGRRADGLPQPSASRSPLEQAVGAVDLLAHVDRELHFLYVSEASLRFIGYHREYLQTITLHDLVAPADVERLDALLARASRHRRRRKGDARPDQVADLSGHGRVARRAQQPRRRRRLCDCRLRRVGLARHRRAPDPCAAPRPPDGPRQSVRADAGAARRPAAGRRARHAGRPAAARHRRLSAREPRARLRRRRRDAARNRAASVEHRDPGRDGSRGSPATNSPFWCPPRRPARTRPPPPRRWRGAC